MANYYEILLVPTNVDNKRLKQRYLQIKNSEDKWLVYPYYPMDLAAFEPAYETLISSVQRAAYDEEKNIVPSKAAFKTCSQWTPALTSPRPEACWRLFRFASSGRGHARVTNWRKSSVSRRPGSA